MFDLKKITEGIDKIGDAMNINRKKTLRANIASQIFVKNIQNSPASIEDLAFEAVQSADILMRELGESDGTK